MRSQKRNILLGGIAALALVVALALGSQGSRLQAYAATTGNAPIVAAPVTADQQRVAAMTPTQEALAKLYDEAAPSVVNIQVTLNGQGAQTAPSPNFPFPFPFPFGGSPFDQGNGQGQPEQQARAEGSGFIYDTAGHIVTNNHVIAEADPDNILVYFANGEWAMARLVARDPQADLAVLQVKAPSDMTLTPLKLAPADSLRVGYSVVAIGSPFGLNETMTVGVVSALGRSMPTSDTADGTPSYSLPDVIQTDTAINPGNSGGPLLDLQGEVVGVNFAIESPARSNAGVGFAIPVSVVDKVIPALIKDGSYRYPYLGIAGQTINATLAQEKKLADNTLGVYVGDVNKDGPAGKAGLQADDILTGIDSQPIHRFEDLLSYLFNQTTPGQKVTLNILRDGKAMSLAVTLAARPTETEQQAASDESGLITAAKAMQIAKAAVQESGLMNNIDSASAKRSLLNGRPLWIVSLNGEGRRATVAIDAQSGAVLELNVQ
jgi:S1-C subfamily serine protease